MTPHLTDLEVPGSLSMEEVEAPPMMVEERQTNIPKEHSPLNIVTRVLGEQALQDKVVESVPGDKGESNNVPIVVPKEIKRRANQQIS